MISLLDSIGPAIWRASWQAGALAQSGHVAFARPWGPHVASLALFALGRGPCTLFIRRDSGQSLERIQHCHWTSETITRPIGAA